MDCQVLALLCSVAGEAYEAPLMMGLAAPNAPATDSMAKAAAVMLLVLSAAGEVYVTFAAGMVGVAYKKQMVEEASLVIQKTTTAD